MNFFLTLLATGCNFASIGSDFIDIGLIPNHKSTALYGMSFDAKYAVGWASGMGQNETSAILWSRLDGLHDISLITHENNSEAYGVSSIGPYIVGARESRAVVWNWSMQTVTHIPEIDGVVQPIARSVSADGTWVIGQAGFRYSQGSGAHYLPVFPTGIQVLDAFCTTPDGTITVGVARNELDQVEGFSFVEDEGCLGLGTLLSSSPNSIATSCSADGSVIVGRANEKQAFRWTEEAGMTRLAWNYHALAVSGDGEVILGVNTDNGLPCLWIKESGPFDLQTYLANSGIPITFGPLYTVDGISGDGTWVCGSGLAPDGKIHGFLARIIRPLGPHSVRANTQNLIYGTVKSGSRRKTFGSDDERLDIDSGVVPSNRLSPVTYDIEGTAARLTPSRLVFTLEAQVSRTGLSQTIDLWNHQTQSWLTLDTRPATVFDSKVSVERTTDAAQFVRPTDGKVKARIRYRATAPGATSTFQVRIDQARWTVHP